MTGGRSDEADPDTSETAAAVVSLATVYFMYRGRINEKKESAVAYTDLSSSDDDQAIDSDVDD